MKVLKKPKTPEVVPTDYFRPKEFAQIVAATYQYKYQGKSPEGDNQIFLYRSKTKVPVYVVIPPEVADLLRKLPNSNPKYFFWSGNGKPTTAKRGYFRSLQKLFKLADIKDDEGAPKRCPRTCSAIHLLLSSCWPEIQ